MKLGNYECFTTFWMDFTIADKFGSEAIHETYNRAVTNWNWDYKYMTELVMVLNWKLWEHYENGNHTTAKIYDKLWQQTDEWCWEHFDEEGKKYYFTVTD